MNVSSTSAYRPLEGRSIYSAAKAAMIGMSRVMALECAKTGVRVNVVAPGHTSSEHALRELDDPEGVAATWVSGRWMTPEEQARLRSCGLLLRRLPDSTEPWSTSTAGFGCRERSGFRRAPSWQKGDVAMSDLVGVAERHLEGTAPAGVTLKHLAPTIGTGGVRSRSKGGSRWRRCRLSAPAVPDRHSAALFQDNPLAAATTIYASLDTSARCVVGPSRYHTARDQAKRPPARSTIFGAGRAISLGRAIGIPISPMRIRLSPPTWQSSERSLPSAARPCSPIWARLTTVCLRG